MRTIDEDFISSNRNYLFATFSQTVLAAFLYGSSIRTYVYTKFNESFNNFVDMCNLLKC